MGQVISIADYKKRKAVELAEYDILECPKCETECAPHKIDGAGAVHYTCQGNGHRKITWRIAENGVMLSGAKGNREYHI